MRHCEIFYYPNPHVYCHVKKLTITYFNNFLTTNTV